MPHLLFADDDEATRHMVRDVLEASGYDVSLAVDGAAALASIEAREPDLLILDVSMPRATGLEVCRAVKANPFTARIPVLLLTGQASVDDRVVGFDTGADGFLAKPFDVRELRARVDSLLRLVRHHADRNPTSGLPGGRAIEDEVTARASRGHPFAVGYLDFDHFKAFADTFGFAAADQVIRGMGDALREVAERHGRGEFVGHIGGDDFLIVTYDTGRGAEITRLAAERLRVVLREVVGDEAMRQGTFLGVDRDGVVKRFPIAEVSAAILLVSPTEASERLSVARLGARAAEMKRRAKARGPGTILCDSV